MAIHSVSSACHLLNKETESDLLPAQVAFLKAKEEIYIFIFSLLLFIFASFFPAQHTLSDMKSCLSKTWNNQEDCWPIIWALIALRHTNAYC